jgi:hypothetical protein
MNRRRFVHAAGLAPLLLTGCGGDSSEAKSRLRQMAERDDLVILGLGNQAVTWNGAYAGSVAFGGVCCRAPVSVAADARCMAWIPWVVSGEGSNREEAALAVRTVPASKKISLQFKLAEQENATLSISAGAQTVAIFAANKLELFDSKSGEPKESLTEIIQTNNRSQPERMQLSADASRLVIGYQNAITVVGIPEREILFSGEGRFPSISPDGRRAVYCRGRRMVLLTLPSRSAELDLGAQVLGIGTWSPDGNMVLAGLRSRFRISATLSAVDWRQRRAAGIEQLSLEDWGERSCWISRSLVA